MLDDMTRALLLSVVLLCAGILCLAQAQMPANVRTVILNPVFPASGAAPFALDGTPVNATGSASSITTSAFSSTFANDVACLALETNGGPSTSVTNANLSGLAKRTSANTGGTAGQFLELWCGTATSALSGSTFSITTTSSSFFVYCVFAFSGGHVAAPFDANGPAQSSTNASYASFTTANMNDILIGVVATTSSSSTNDAAWTALNNTNFLNVEYRLVSSIQSPINIAPGAIPSNGGGSIADAIIKGP